ncbi:hypothetical protein [Peribacillus sp. Hz7]|uniref:hypothetical protein n=1 Tax=Peribacillus sp. Hz7 TaxID=3344873 RepID=UPI0035CA0914
MLWDSEAHFVDEFIHSNEKIVSSLSYDSLVVKELKTGYGRPDIALIQYDRQILCSRNSTKDSISQIGCYAISYLASRRWVSVEKLGDFLRINNRKLFTIIEELISLDLISQRNHLVKARPKSEIMAVKRILTFEAKLQNWQEAIDQAERHLWFTNESYVLMPYLSEKLADKILKECIKKGVGLSFYDSELGYKTVANPAKKGINNSPFIWAINEKLMEVENESKPIFSRV